MNQRLPHQPSAASNDHPPAACLAVNRREAARLLGVSERLLWTWTNLNRIPHTRMGNRVLYPVELLREWLNSRSKSVTA